MKTPKELWEEYKGLVYTDGPIPPQQEKECSLAFYAGMLSMMAAAAGIPDHLEDEQMDEFVAQLKQETENTHGYY